MPRIAHKRGFAVHMDGARLANALARMNASPAEATWKAGVDVLSFGATKGGALAAEAILFFDPARGAGMSERRKRGGHLVSKHRYRRPDGGLSRRRSVAQARAPRQRHGRSARRRTRARGACAGLAGRGKARCS